MAIVGSRDHDVTTSRGTASLHYSKAPRTGSHGVINLLTIIFNQSIIQSQDDDAKQRAAVLHGARRSGSGSSRRRRLNDGIIHPSHLGASVRPSVSATTEWHFSSFSPSLDRHLSPTDRSSVVHLTAVCVWL